MIRFIASVLRAIANLAASAAKGIADALDAVLDAIKRIFGDGGGGPAMPVKDIAKFLPDASALKMTKNEVQGAEQTLDFVRSMNQSTQVKMYAMTPEEHRYSADIGLLATPQQAWLRGLDEDQLQRVAASTDRQVDDALKGLPLSIPLVSSFGDEVKPESVINQVLASRISAHRALARSEFQNVVH